MEVGPHDPAADPPRRMKQVVVVVPIDADVSKAQHIAQQDWEHWQQCGEIGPSRDLQLEHHDGDDDRQHPVAERFDPSLGHRSLRGSFVSESYRAVNRKWIFLALAPDKRNLRDLECDRSPAGPQLRQPFFELRTSLGLPHAQVRHETSAVARCIIALRAFLLKRRLQPREGCGQLRGKPERKSSLSVREVAQLAERRAKGLDCRAGAPKLELGLGKECPGPERIEQREVRHPPLQVSVVPAADGLNGLPNVVRWNDHDSGMVRLVHKSPSQETTRAGSSSRFSLVTCHSSAPGSRFTSAMKPAPRWATVAMSGRSESSSPTTASTNALERHSILPISSTR